MKFAFRVLLIAVVCLLPVTSFASVTSFFLDNEPAPLFEPAALALLGVGLVLTARTLRVKDEQN